MIFSIKKIITLFIIIIFFIPYLYTLKDPFFWDTIQFAGKHGLHFFENGWTILPDDIDSGHLPFLGYYLANLWHIFNKTLFVSHLAMLPFLVIYIAATYALANLINPNIKYFAWALFLLEPCFLAQSTLVTPDVILMSGFSLMLFGVISKSNIWVFPGSVLMVCAGNRGAVMVFALGVYWLWLNRKSWVKSLLFLTPATCLFVGYQLWHFYTKGWIGYHSEMAWSPSFERVNNLGVLRNFLIMVWRMMDTGRIILFLAFLYFVAINFTRRKKNAPRIFFLFSIVALCLAFLTLPYKYLTGHRYYMPLYFLMILYVVISIPEDWKRLKKNCVLSFILVFFIIGHLLKYPNGIAMGWDATLGYLPYQKLRRQAIERIKMDHLKVNEIGSYFPNISGFNFTDLDSSNPNERFVQVDTSQQDYILVSNLMNDMPIQLNDKIIHSWSIIYSWKSGNIEMTLYQKP